MEIISPEHQTELPIRHLPNATAVLILGILSLPGCCCYGAGLILGIIALVLNNKDQRLYRQNPSLYSLSSYNNLNAGKVCAIIGLIFSCLYLMLIGFMLSIFGISAFRNPEALQQALQKLQH